MCVVPADPELLAELPADLFIVGIRIDIYGKPVLGRCGIVFEADQENSESTTAPRKKPVLGHRRTHGLN